MNKKRLYYSDDFKRSALLKVMQGFDFEDILSKSNYDIKEQLKKDKKYCSKLLYKWRQEVYKNNELVYFINTDMSISDIQAEIENLKENNEPDLIMQNIEEKILQNEEKYQTLKKRIYSK